MNINKLNNKIFLEELILDNEELEEQINETKGYIFYLLKQHKVYPDKQFLLNTKNPYAIKYVTENYDLNEEDKVQIRSLFLLESNTNIYQVQLTNEQIDYYLENDLPLPIVKLSIEQLNTHKEKLVSLAQNNLLNINNIVEYSLQEKSLKDYKNLSIDIIAQFNIVPQLNWLQDRDFALFYKKNTLDIIKKFEDRTKPVLENFVRFPFKEDDKDFLDELITNSILRHSTFGNINFKYEYLKNFNGITSLISQEEFILKYNYYYLKDISTDVLLDNKENLQTLWLNQVDKNPNKKDIYAILMSIEAEKEILEQLLDTDFLSKVFQLYPKITLVKNDIHNESLQPISNIIIENYLKLYGDNPISNNNIDFQIVFDWMGAQYPTVETNTEQIYQYCTRNLMEHLDSHGTTYDFFNTEIYWPSHFKRPYFKDYVKQYPSVNLLLLLLKNYKKDSSFHYLGKKYIEAMAPELIVSILSNLSQENEIILPEMFEKYEVVYPVLEYTIINSANTVNNFSNNIFAYKNLADLSLLTPDVIHILLKEDESFKDFILDKNIKIEDKVLYQLLKSNDFNEFIEKYLLANKKDYFNNNDILNYAYKRELKIFDENKKHNDEKIYDKLKFLQAEQKLLNEEYQQMKLEVNGNEQKQLMLEYKNKETEKNIDEQFNLKKELTISFVENKLKELLLNENFNETKYLNNWVNNKFYKETLSTYLQSLSFNKLYNLCENEDFIFMLKDNITIYDIFSVNFLSYEDKEIKQIYHRLKEKSFEPLVLISMIDNSRQELIKEMILTEIPENIFINPLLAPNGNRFVESLVKIKYTPEETLNIFSNLKGSFFDSEDNNPLRFFIYNLKDKEDYLHLLNLAENTPKLYAILAYPEIINKFIPTDISRSEFCHTFIKEHFNIEILCEGIKQVYNDSIEQKDHINSTYIRSYFDTVFKGFEYINLDENGTNIRECLFSNQEKNYIMNALWNISPAILLHEKLLAESLMDYVSRDGHNFKEHNLIDIIQSIRDLYEMNNNLSMSYVKKNFTEVSKYLIINDMNERNYEQLLLLKYTLEADDFINNNLIIQNIKNYDDSHIEFTLLLTKDNELHTMLEVMEKHNNLEKIVPNKDFKKKGKKI